MEEYMMFEIVYTDGTSVVKEFNSEADCAEWCHLEGDHVLYFDRVE
jgi:hypothetical protein